MIEIKNVSKNFGAIKALDDVSLAANKGELVVLLGPNGAGKTTLLRIICGYLFPDAGQVLIEGENAAENLRPYLQKIGYMPENIPLYPEMKAAEYLEFVRRIFAVPATEEYNKLLADLALTDILSQKAGTLSKGYKKRLGIAAAMCHRPAVLVLDEPTEGLDPNQKQTVRRLLKDYAKEHLVLVSTHLLSEAETMADRVWIMRQGQAIKNDSVAGLKALSPNGDLAAVFYNLTQG